MKRSIFTLVIVPVLLFIGCEPTDREGLEGTADTTDAFMQDEMVQFRSDVDATLADIDSRIDSLEVFADEASDDMSMEIDSAVASLRERRDAVQLDLQQLEMATEETYEDVRADVEIELNDLETDVQMAWERYRDEDQYQEADPGASS